MFVSFFLGEKPNKISGEKRTCETCEPVCECNSPGQQQRHAFPATWCHLQAAPPATAAAPRAAPHVHHTAAAAAVEAAPAGYGNHFVAGHEIQSLRSRLPAPGATQSAGCGQLWHCQAAGERVHTALQAIHGDRE